MLSNYNYNFTIKIKHRWRNLYIYSDSKNTNIKLAVYRMISKIQVKTSMHITQIHHQPMAALESPNLSLTNNEEHRSRMAVLLTSHNVLHMYSPESHSLHLHQTHQTHHNPTHKPNPDLLTSQNHTSHQNHLRRPWNHHSLQPLRSHSTPQEQTRRGLLRHTLQSRPRLRLHYHNKKDL